jgi:hypothetical protein
MLCRVTVFTAMPPTGFRLLRHTGWEISSRAWPICRCRNGLRYQHQVPLSEPAGLNNCTPVLSLPTTVKWAVLRAEGPDNGVFQQIAEISKKISRNGVHSPPQNRRRVRRNRFTGQYTGIGAHTGPSPIGNLRG